MKAVEIAKKYKDIDRNKVLRTAKELGFKPEGGHVEVAARGAWDFDQYATTVICSELDKIAVEKGENALEKAAKAEPAAAPQPADSTAFLAVLDVLKDELKSKNAQILDLQDQLATANADLAKANATIQRLQNRTWLDRLLGRGLPAPAKTE